MTSLLVEMRRPIDPPADDGFEVSYVSGDGAGNRVPLAQAWAAPLEQGSPVRRPSPFCATNFEPSTARRRFDQSDWDG